MPETAISKKDDLSSRQEAQEAITPQAELENDEIKPAVVAEPKSPTEVLADHRVDDPTERHLQQIKDVELQEDNEVPTVIPEETVHILSRVDTTAEKPQETSQPEPVHTQKKLSVANIEKPADHKEVGSIDSRPVAPELTRDVSVYEIDSSETTEVSEEVGVDEELLQHEDGLLVLKQDETLATILDEEALDELDLTTDYHEGGHEDMIISSVADLQELINIIYIQEDEQQSSELREELLQTEEDPTKEAEFMDHLVAYVQSLLPNPELSDIEQPAATTVEMLSIAQEIQELQNDTLEIDINGTTIQEKTEELQQLCAKLFKELGIEADETTIARIVDTFIAKVMAHKTAEQAPEIPSIEELAQQGTHEYKLASWFNQFLQQPEPLSRVVGTVALRLSATL